MVLQVSKYFILSKVLEVLIRTDMKYDGLEDLLHSRRYVTFWSFFGEVL